MLSLRPLIYPLLLMIGLAPLAPTFASSKQAKATDKPGSVRLFINRAGSGKAMDVSNTLEVPVEVTREVPVEVTREVPVERRVIKEVPKEMLKEVMKELLNLLNSITLQRLFMVQILRSRLTQLSSVDTLNLLDYLEVTILLQ